jgi:hypothetical protein
MKFDPKIHHRPFASAQGRRSIRLKGYDIALWVTARRADISSRWSRRGAK